MFRIVEPSSSVQAVEDELRSVIARAHQGDVESLPRLRQLLDNRPEIWNVNGDVAAHA